MIYRLPNIRSDKEGFDAIATLYSEVQHLEFDSLELSFAGVSWFDANMAAPLGATLARVQDKYNMVSIVDITWSQRSILLRNGFLRGFGYSAPDQYHRGTVLPYERFKTTDANRFYDYLEEHLPGKGMPEMTSDFSLRFLQSMGEIFINSQTHSESELGVFVCGQFYPTKQRLDISIADAGITIPGKVVLRFSVNLAPVKALRWALIEGNTTKEDAPGGIGLKLLKDFINYNGGCIRIVSGKAFWEFQKGNEDFYELKHEFPGTTVNLEVNTGDNNAYGQKTGLGRR